MPSTKPLQRGTDVPPLPQSAPTEGPRAALRWSHVLLCYKHSLLSTDYNVYTLSMNASCVKALIHTALPKLLSPLRQIDDEWPPNYAKHHHGRISCCKTLILACSPFCVLCDLSVMFSSSCTHFFLSSYIQYWSRHIINALHLVRESCHTSLCVIDRSSSIQPEYEQGHKLSLLLHLDTKSRVTA